MSAITVGLTDDLATCLAIRRVVFIEGQNVPEEEEVDGRDGEALHLLAHRDGEAIGTARMLIDGESGKIGRVAVLEGARGQGAGRALMLAALQELRTRGLREAWLGSQTHALAFYEALGFQAVGPEFIDAGISHRMMMTRLT